MHRWSSAGSLAATALAVSLVVAARSGNGASMTPATSAETASVAEAKSLGFVPIIEYCRNRTLFPDRYRDVAFEDLDGGMCAFYFPPDAETPAAEPPPTTSKADRRFPSRSRGSRPPSSDSLTVRSTNRRRNKK